MIQPVFLHVTQPIGTGHLITNLGQRGKTPFFIFFQRVRVLSSFQEYTRHLIQVILKTVKIL